MWTLALLAAACGRRDGRVLEEASESPAAAVESLTPPVGAAASLREQRCCGSNGDGEERIHCADPELLGRLRLGRTEALRTPGHALLQVSLPIENASAREVRLAVQVEFLDASRAFYGDRTTRRLVVIPPGRTHRFRATSARSKAASFVVLLTRP